MQKQAPTKFNLIGLVIVIIFFAFFTNPVLGGILLVVGIIKAIKNSKLLSFHLSSGQKNAPSGTNFLDKINLSVDLSNIHNPLPQNKVVIPAQTSAVVSKPKRLERRKKYLHIALNSTLEGAEEIIAQLPHSDRILIEVGTPLIKIYGTDAIGQIKSMVPAGTYIVADNKCADLAPREVEMVAHAGANAATCLGVAPIETIDAFIEECQKFNIDSMIDMMNVENALAVLKKLKKLPDVVMLHRGVDESEFSKEKQIPFYQIKQIKGNYNTLVAVAGGDTIREVQRAIFNDADIVVVWKSFYQPSSETAQLAESFLKEIK
ncbi:MAG TPA: orotidine 5'-phosphate decarboxylase [bacterium]|nr:orotidine 5'-phosphate decarboxylase [bacterium]